MIGELTFHQQRVFAFRMQALQHTSILLASGWRTPISVAVEFFAVSFSQQKSIDLPDNNNQKVVLIVNESEIRPHHSAAHFAKFMLPKT
ncbi:MAG: hypothetical protein AAFY56_23360 [Pseudomonadota bacterium]